MKKILLLPMLILLAGCGGGTTNKELVRSVKCDTVRQAAASAEQSQFPGKVKAASEANVAFRIAGPIVKVNVNEGQFVRKGTVLAEMDARDYKTQLSATQAEYNRVKAEAERVMELYKKKSATANDYDKAVYGLGQITAKLEAHTNALADTRLTAPFDGYVQKKHFDAGETVAAGMPVVSMISSGAPEVEINIPTADFIKRGSYASAVCRIDVFGDKEFPLELVGINQKANLNQLYTTRFRIKGIGAEQPAPGMTAMVTINYKSGAAAMSEIPLSAVVGGSGGSFVWVYEADSVRQCPVRVLQITTDGKAIVSEGVREGDIVVSGGAKTLKAGQKVKVSQPKSSTNVGGVL